MRNFANDLTREIFWTPKFLTLKYILGQQNFENRTCSAITTSTTGKQTARSQMMKDIFLFLLLSPEIDVVQCQENERRKYFLRGMVVPAVILVKKLLTLHIIKSCKIPSYFNMSCWFHSSATRKGKLNYPLKVSWSMCIVTCKGNIQR